MSRAIRGAALLIGFAVALASCGRSGGTAAGSSGSPVQGAGSAGACPASAGLPSPANDQGAVTATGSTVSIEAKDFFFAPTCMTKLPAGSVTLMVHNTGQALHNVTIQPLGIDEDVAAGKTITVTVKMGNSPLPFVCKYHRTSGMVGALLPVGM